MKRTVVWLAISLGLFACSTNGGVVEQIPDADSVSPTDQIVDDVMIGETPGVEDVVEAVEDLGFELFVPVDLAAELPVPQCDQGDGCFLDGCDANDDCQSGWCVQHLGEDVCTKTCQQECPPGWTCSQVAGTDPDVVYICVSDYANLCRPCATNANCTSTGGAEDACLDYGSLGNFCGAPCGVDDGCPWGFSCLTTATVDGVELSQCVNDTGECPCTKRSVELGLTTPCTLANDSGTCSGLRICTEDGLSICDASEPVDEFCNGLDDDCDGEVDEPALVAGDYVNLCDDGSDCTEDECAGLEGCVNVLLNSGQCNDGNPCTVADHCVEGNCTGSEVECNDDNPCTDDLCTDTGGCEFPAVDGQCDDDDPCTVGDFCSAGECEGTHVPCECQVDADCEELEDGDLCNGSLICDDAWPPFQCVVEVESEIVCPEPNGPHAPCLVAACDPATGDCTLLPANDEMLCDDGNACTVNDLCAGGECVSGFAVNCNDGSPCTDDSCDPDGGCSSIDNNDECNDDDVCTTADQCINGECVGGPILQCNDGNPCTADSCESSIGCQHLSVAGDCDDENACTTGDHCAAGVCAFEAILQCDDGNVCTDDSCDSSEGCVTTTNQAICDDGDACTSSDVCQDGGCQGTAVIDCDDGNPCTSDSCDPVEGCQYDANDLGCDDGNTCTVGDHCALGACVTGGLLNCGDDNVCTNDTCDPAAGCINTLNSAPCDDGDLCTTGDKCQLGECAGLGNLTCIDGNVCTDDSCDPQVGCQFVANDAACDDGDACTDGDICASGWCSSGPPVYCFDGNDCTDDSCAPQSGCEHSNVENGSACIDEGIDKICVDGECLCKPACEGKECGPDGCGGTCGTCEDDDECTLNEDCDAGSCVSTALECDDDNLCTDDSCEPAQGCVYLNNAVPCDDGNPCTANDVCGEGSCSGEGIPQLAAFEFSNAGATGRLGPSQSNVDNAYNGTNLAGKVGAVGGIQSWIVPYSGTYTVEAAGAKGGDGGGNNPGKGALQIGDFELQAGTNLKVVVGQVGSLSKQGCCWKYGCSGGGGASWVYTDANADLPLLIAAGGGGHAENATAGHGSATTGANAATGGSGTSGSGGNGGNGGSAGPTSHSYSPGAGGAGWLTNGQTAPTIRNPGGKGGKAPRNGAEGGFGTHNNYGAEHCSGGFGGGGAGSDNTGAGGGGGGFNGGGGGRNYAGGGSWGAGGGGGSYNGGANQSNQGGTNDSHGYVTVTFECN